MDKKRRYDGGQEVPRTLESAVEVPNVLEIDSWDLENAVKGK